MEAIDAGKLPWDFTPGQQMTPEFRKARALEYIAYYLDRIDLQLTKIAYTVTQDPAGQFTVLKCLQDIAEAVQEMKRD
jgi:hypothetical protein